MHLADIFRNIFVAVFESSIAAPITFSIFACLCIEKKHKIFLGKFSEYGVRHESIFHFPDFRFSDFDVIYLRLNESLLFTCEKNEIQIKT